MYDVLLSQHDQERRWREIGGCKCCLLSVHRIILLEKVTFFYAFNGSEWVVRDISHPSQNTLMETSHTSQIL